MIWLRTSSFSSEKISYSDLQPVQNTVFDQDPQNCVIPGSSCKYIKGNKEIDIPADSLNNPVNIPASWKLTIGNKYELNATYSIWHPDYLRFEDHDSGSMVLYNGDKIVFEIYSIGLKNSSQSNLEAYLNDSVLVSGFKNMELRQDPPQDKVQYSQLSFTNDTLFYQVFYPYFHTYDSQENEPENNDYVEPPFSNYNSYKYILGKPQGDYFVVVYDYQLLQSAEVEQILANMKIIDENN